MKVFMSYHTLIALDACTCIAMEDQTRGYHGKDRTGGCHEKDWTGGRTELEGAG